MLAAGAGFASGQIAAVHKVVIGDLDLYQAGKVD